MTTKKTKGEEWARPQRRDAIRQPSPPFDSDLRWWHPWKQSRIKDKEIVDNQMEHGKHNITYYKRQNVP
jgi:hypothetical protein